jgi:uncharacterized protein (TIRG00374 family)
MKKKKLLLTVLKITVTVLLAVIIIKQADWYEVFESLKQANILLIFIVLVCMIVNVSVSTLKWNILLKVHGINFSFSDLHRFYFTSVFFNNFLPTNIGGDTYRVYRTIKNGESKIGGFLAVLTERFTGIIALLLLGLVGALVLWVNDIGGLRETKSIILLFGLLIFGSFIAIILGYIVVKLLQKNGHLPWKIKIFKEHVKDYLNNPKEFLYIIFLSFFFHLFTAFMMSILIMAVGPSFPPVNLIVVLAVTNVVAMLPISINGIGLMDGSFIYVASHLGMNYEQALMVMLLNRAFLLLLSLIGGFYYVKDKTNIKAVENTSFNMTTKKE